MKYFTLITIFTIGLGIASLLLISNQFVIDAAIFDAPLLPAYNNQYNLGNAANQNWRDAMFSGNVSIFNTATTSGNLSIGTTTPSERLTIIDGNISQNLKSQTGISTINNFVIGDRSRSIYISGKYAYLLTDYISDSLKIIDISNPLSPSIVSSLTLPNSGAEIYVSGKYAYVSSLIDYLTIIDISTASAPQITASVLTPASSRIFISGQYAYLIDPYSSKFFIMNIANPTNPFLTASSTLGLSINKSIYVSGRYAYVSGYFSTTASLGIIDISNQNYPKVLTNYSIDLGINTEGHSGGLYVSGSYAYMPISYNYSSYFLAVINIADPTSPQLYATTTINMPGSALYGTGKYLYIVDDNVNGKMSIVDISNPKNPKQITTYPVGYRPNNIKISGKYAYITNWDWISSNPSFTIIDISGLEAVSAEIHSLEAGNLQVRNNITAQGQLQIAGGINVGTGGIFSAGPIGVSISSTTQTDAVSAYFQGRVGIATTIPSQKLEVWGGLRLNPDGAQPDSTKPATCSASIRGLLWFTSNVAGTADTLEICNSSSTEYVWKKLY